MKKFRIVAIAILTMLFSTAVYAQTGSVSVTVDQIDVARGGKISIGLYDVEGFPVIGKGVQEVALDVNAGSMEYVFKNIPAGKYAIAVFQDINTDGKLNKNLVGAPKEPYGFSKNIYGMFGPPDFEDVAFEVIADQPISLIINLD